MNRHIIIKKIAEKKATTPVVIFVGIIAMLIIVIVLTIKISMRSRSYELTEEETELLTTVYSDAEENIQQGKLGPGSARLLEKIRFGMVYLEEKYPGYCFHMQYISDWPGIYEECVITEEITGYQFDMHIFIDDDNQLVAEDNFYRYFLEEKFDEYLEKELSDKIEGVVEVDTYMPFVKGKNYGMNISVEDVISRKMDINSSIYIDISAKNMTKEDCDTYLKRLGKIIKEIDPNGIITVLFWNMSEDEMNKSEEYEDQIACGYIKKEEEWKTGIY